MISVLNVLKECNDTKTSSINNSRIPTAQGKQGKWQKKLMVIENTGNLEVWTKQREFVLLKLLIADSKVRDISIFAANIS